jgi:type II secretory pathway pseudopilin PulG
MTGMLDLHRRWRSGRSAARGSILAAVLVMMALGAIWAGAASTQWSFILKREREKELIFRGTQIVRGIEDFSSRGAPPTSLEQLTKFPKPTLRQAWADPMTERHDSNGDLIEGTGKWKLLTRGQPAPTTTGATTAPPSASSQVGSTIHILPLRGVASLSEEESIGGYRNIPPGGPYTEWQFEVFGSNANPGGQTGASQGGFDLERPPGFGGLRQPGGPPVPPSAGMSQGVPRQPASAPPRPPTRGVGGLGR